LGWTTEEESFFWAKFKKEFPVTSGWKTFWVTPKIVGGEPCELTWEG